MKIEIVNLAFPVRPLGGGITTTSYTTKDYLMEDHPLGVAVRYRLCPGQMLLLPWSNICGIQYRDVVDAAVETPHRGPVMPPPRDDPEPAGGGRFRKAG